MKNHFEDIINRIAEEHSLPASEVRKEMMEAIHAAYTTVDSDARDMFRRIFGDVEPSLEEFISKMLVELDKRTSHKQIRYRDQGDVE